MAGIPILDIGCGSSVDLNSALSTVDNMINDMLNGIGDITGAIANAVSSALGELGTALGKMLPDLSDLVPDISFSAGIDALLGFVEGSLGYLAKLAELTLQFGKAILNAGLNIFDMIADAALAFLKGLDPCSALSDDFSIGADGVAKASAAAVKYLKFLGTSARYFSTPLNIAFAVVWVALVKFGDGCLLLAFVPVTAWNWFFAVKIEKMSLLLALFIITAITYALSSSLALDSAAVAATKLYHSSSVITLPKYASAICLALLVGGLRIKLVLYKSFPVMNISEVR